jgi:hypothetical protein
MTLGYAAEGESETFDSIAERKTYCKTRGPGSARVLRKNDPSEGWFLQRMCAASQSLHFDRHQFLEIAPKGSAIRVNA